MDKCGLNDAFAVTCNYILVRVHIKVMYALHPPPAPPPHPPKKQTITKTKQNAKKPIIN